MPLAITVGKFIVDSLVKSDTFNKVVGAGILGAYFGWENKDKIMPSFGAPSGTHNVPLTLPTTKPVSGAGFVLSGNAPAVPSIIPKNPSLSPVFDPAFEAFRQSKLHGEITSADSYTALRTKADAVNAKNTTLAQTAGVSPFLANMVESKSSIDEVAFAINAQSVIHAMTLESLERNLGLLSSALIGIAGLKSMEYEHTETIANSTALISKSPAVPDYNIHLEKMAAHAVSAKVVTDHAQTSRAIHDLDGDHVVTMAPMAITAVHEATKARTATDVNSEEFSPDMIPDVSLLVLPFVGSSGIYNPNYVSPLSNPFTHKTF